MNYLFSKLYGHGSSLIIACLVLSRLCLPAYANQTPGEAYLALHQKELTAKSYKDLTALRTKSSVATDKPVSPQEQQMMFELFKAMQMPVVRVTSEEVHGFDAVVHAEPVIDPKTQDPTVTEKTVGTINLVMEDGQWKIDSEKWESKIISTANPSPMPVKDNDTSFEQLSK